MSGDDPQRPRLPRATEVTDGIDLRGRHLLVTGATSGLGRESARALAETGATVLVAGRSPAALRETHAWVSDLVPHADLRLVELDLGDLRSVAAAAAEISATVPSLDVVMNNAGVMFTPLQRTADGFELQMGVNHLGHFALTELLTPLLRRAEAPRVVVLASGGYRLGMPDLSDLQWETRPYDKFEAYGASKSANLLHVTGLQRRLADAGADVFGVNPGAVATSLARHMSSQDFSALKVQTVAVQRRRGAAGDGRLDFSSPGRGASTQVWAAVADELSGCGGAYLEDRSISDDLEPPLRDDRLADALWDLSQDACASVLAGA